MNILILCFRKIFPYVIGKRNYMQNLKGLIKNKNKTYIVAACKHFKKSVISYSKIQFNGFIKFLF